MSVGDALHRLGCRPRGRHRWSPCPVCRAEVDSGRRGPIHTSGATVFCNACGFEGSPALLVRDALDLTWQEAYRWLEGSTAEPAVQAAPREPVRPPADLLRAELRRAVPLREVHRPDLRAWLARRAIPASAPALWLPSSKLLPPGYPLVVPMYGPSGQLLSLQGRALDGRKVKARHPYGYDADGLLFADPSTALPFLGGGPTPGRIFVVEGLTDFLGLAARTHDAVLGVVSGSVACFRVLAPRLAGARVFVATDAGRQGDAYARGIATALHPLPTFRVDLRAVAPLVA